MDASDQQNDSCEMGSPVCWQKYEHETDTPAYPQNRHQSSGRQNGLRSSQENIIGKEVKEKPTFEHHEHSNTVPVVKNTVTDHVKMVVNDGQSVLKAFLAEDLDLDGMLPAHRTDKYGNTKDVEWGDPASDISYPLIDGIRNDVLWSLIRRFNKDVFDVKSIPKSNELDLEESWGDDYLLERLSLNFQRMYLTVILGLASGRKQLARLRSWKETRRTACFCLVYYSAWMLDLLVPVTVGAIMVLITSAKVRNVCFPPLPRSIVDANTGKLQKPEAGHLGTFGTLTGASEKQAGEAVDQEATNFVSNLGHLIMRAVGMHEGQGEDGNPLEKKIPKPIRNIAKAIKAKGSAPGHATNENEEKTQEPMEEIIWSKAKPENLWPMLVAAPHVLGDIADNWERVAKYASVLLLDPADDISVISPMPPFPDYQFVRLYIILLPMLVISIFITSYMAWKAASFFFGFILFGDPILTPCLQWLGRRHRLRKYLHPKHHILRGVPTNNQLVLTLLRIGEAHQVPIFPPAKLGDGKIIQPPFLEASDVPIAANQSLLDDITKPSDGDNQDSKQPSHKRISGILSTLKSNITTGVEWKLGLDHLKARAGCKKAQDHVGIFIKSKNLIYSGPSTFKGRYQGENGWVVLTTDSNPRCSFTRQDIRNIKSREAIEPVFTVCINDIHQLRRVTTFINGPVEMAADWASDKELLGSVEIIDKHGENWVLTALPQREELYNRLVSIGHQRWEKL